MADNVGEQKPLLSGAKSPARSKPRESDDHILLEEEQDNLDMSKGHGDKKQPSAMFGVRLFNYRLSRRPNPPVRDEPAGEGYILPKIGYVIWVVLFGWWMALLFMITAGVLLLTIVGRPYAKLCWKLKSYYFWPFGKFVIEKVRVDENMSLMSGKSEPLGPYIVWLFIYCIFLLPILFICYIITWFFVISIPMAKVNWEMIKLLFTKPRSLTISDSYEGAQNHHVLLCTHQAFNASYFKHSVWGMNIVFFNLFPLVAIRVVFIVIGMIIETHHLLPPVAQFFLDLLCSIPITFYIGLAIASIAAQTNYMVGALLNATFGSITELTLYTMAIRKSGLDDLILYSVTGGLLSDMLLLPGMSMIAGGIKYKEQKFNPVAAGVGSILLFIAVVGAFAPTIFYHTFGMSSSNCGDCIFNYAENGTKLIGVVCHKCQFHQKDLVNDPIFMEGARYLMYFSACILPLAYIIGMIFTFKTHTHLFKQEEQSEHEHPEWSVWASILLMLVSITMFGLIAEDVVHLVQDVLEALGVHQSFLGLTLIALTPAATELASAIKFALANQISLSVEIGSASAVQISLIQVPAVTAISLIFGATDKHGAPFSLIFPMLSVFAVVFACITFNYISSEGKTNYFVGAAMVIIYIILIASFYYIPDDVTTPPGNSTDISHFNLKTEL